MSIFSTDFLNFTVNRAFILKYRAIEMTINPGHFSSNNTIATDMKVLGDARGTF